MQNENDIQIGPSKPSVPQDETLPEANFTLDETQLKKIPDFTLLWELIAALNKAWQEKLDIEGDKVQKEFFSTVAAYLHGGAIRDMIVSQHFKKEIPIDDFDILLLVPLEIIDSLVGKFPGLSRIGENLFLLKGKGFQLELAIYFHPNLGKVSLLRKRLLGIDTTPNAIGMEINSDGNWKLIDLKNGIDAIKNRECILIEDEAVALGLDLKFEKNKINKDKIYKMMRILRMFDLNAKYQKFGLGWSYGKDNSLLKIFPSFSCQFKDFTDNGSMLKQLYKSFSKGYALLFFNELIHYNIAIYIFPNLAKYQYEYQTILAYFDAQSKLKLSVAELFSLLLWAPFSAEFRKIFLSDEGKKQKISDIIAAALESVEKNSKILFRSEFKELKDCYDTLLKISEPNINFDQLFQRFVKERKRQRKEKEKLFKAKLKEQERQKIAEHAVKEKEKIQQPNIKDVAEKQRNAEKILKKDEKKKRIHAEKEELKKEAEEESNKQKEQEEIKAEKSAEKKAKKAEKQKIKEELNKKIAEENKINKAAETLTRKLEKEEEKDILPQAKPLQNFPKKIKKNKISLTRVKSETLPSNDSKITENIDVNIENKNTAKTVLSIPKQQQKIIEQLSAIERSLPKIQIALPVKHSLMSFWKPAFLEDMQNPKYVAATYIRPFYFALDALLELAMNMSEQNKLLNTLVFHTLLSVADNLILLIKKFKQNEVPTLTIPDASRIPKSLLTIKNKISYLESLCLEHENLLKKQQALRHSKVKEQAREWRMTATLAFVAGMVLYINAEKKSPEIKNDLVTLTSFFSISFYVLIAWFDLVHTIADRLKTNIQPEQLLRKQLQENEEKILQCEKEIKDEIALVIEKNSLIPGEESNPSDIVAVAP